MASTVMRLLEAIVVMIRPAPPANVRPSSDPQPVSKRPPAGERGERGEEKQRLPSRRHPP